jgi:hypothetical protein
MGGQAAPGSENTFEEGRVRKRIFRTTSRSSVRNIAVVENLRRRHVGEPF